MKALDGQRWAGPHLQAAQECAHASCNARTICVHCGRRRTILQTMLQPAVHGLARGRGRPRACPPQHAQAICTSQQSVLGACSIHTCLQTSPFPCRMTAIGPPWVPAQLGGRAQPSLGQLPTNAFHTTFSRCNAGVPVNVQSDVRHDSAPLFQRPGYTC